MHSSDWTPPPAREFRATSQKIPLQIISLIKSLSRSRHMWGARRKKAAAAHGARLHQLQNHRQREDAGAVGVRDAEALVLEPRADVPEVRLRPRAPGELGAGVREGEERSGRARAAAQF